MILDTAVHSLPSTPHASAGRSHRPVLPSYLHLFRATIWLAAVDVTPGRHERPLLLLHVESNFHITSTEWTDLRGGRRDYGDETEWLQAESRLHQRQERRALTTRLSDSRGDVWRRIGRRVSIG